MNEQLFLLNTQKKTTNHILHLLLCIPTCGLWLIVWGTVASSNKRHNLALNKKMTMIAHMKASGASDAETYNRINQKQQGAPVLGIVLMVVLFLAFLAYEFGSK